MPPPRYTPAVATERRPRLPASAPSAPTNSSSVSAQPGQYRPSPAREISAGWSAAGASGGTAPQPAPPCTKRWMLTSPGPETTCSYEARPKRAVRVRASSASRSLRAAKSAWPASDGAGTKRLPTRCSSVSPRPVPGAMRAALPAASASPARMTASWSPARVGTACASAARSFSSATRGIASASPTCRASTRHGTFVNWQTSPRTGPATPKQAASSGPLQPTPPRNAVTSSTSPPNSSVGKRRTACGRGAGGPPA